MIRKILSVLSLLGALGAGLALAQEPDVKWNTDSLTIYNREPSAPPGLEDFYDKGFYGPPQIYCTNGYDFEIWIVTKDGAVTVPAGGHFVLTRKDGTNGN